jgi:flagellar biosynthesis protein FlhG
MELSGEEYLGLFHAIEQLAESFDYLLIDTAAGIGRGVTFFSSAAHEVICVSNDEPTALTDAYALVKVLSKEFGEKRFRVLMNDVSDDFRAKRAFERLRNAAEKHLQVKTEYLGCIPSGPEVREAILDQRAVVQEHPSSRVGRAFVKLAEQFESEEPKMKNSGGMQFFFEAVNGYEVYGS